MGKVTAAVFAALDSLATEDEIIFWSNQSGSRKMSKTDLAGLKKSLLNGWTSLTIASNATTWDCLNNSFPMGKVSASANFTLKFKDLKDASRGVLLITKTGTADVTVSFNTTMEVTTPTGASNVTLNFNESNLSVTTRVLKGAANTVHRIYFELDGTTVRLENLSTMIGNYTFDQAGIVSGDTIQFDGTKFIPGKGMVLRRTKSVNRTSNEFNLDSKATKVMWVERNGVVLDAATDYIVVDNGSAAQAIRTTRNALITDVYIAVYVETVLPSIMNITAAFSDIQGEPIDNNKLKPHLDRANASETVISCQGLVTIMDYFKVKTLIDSINLVDVANLKYRVLPSTTFLNATTPITFEANSAVEWTWTYNTADTKGVISINGKKI
jgi:hypothetical protein